MAVYELKRRFVGNVRVVQVHLTVEEFELRRVFAKVASKADLAQLVTEIAVAAEKQRYTPGAPCHASDSPRGGPARLAVVDADVGRPQLRRQVAQQREHRNAAGAQLRHGRGHGGMIRGDHGKSVRLAPKTTDHVRRLLRIGALRK